MNIPKLSKLIGEISFCDKDIIKILEGLKTGENVKGTCLFSISSDEDVSWREPLNKLVIDYQTLEFEL